MNEKDEEEEKPSTPTLEEGVSQLIKSDETIYALIKNTEKAKNKIFISINYPEKTEETEFVSLFTDLECKNLFQELKPQKGFNNFYNFDISLDQTLFLKSNHPSGIYFYYKYCTETDIEQINIIKKKLKVKCLENKDNQLKISFDAPYTKEVKFNTKYTIYVNDGKGKKYKIFKDDKIEGKRIVEGVKDKYETEVKIDSSKKDQFVYVVAEPKDPTVNLRPKIIYRGDQVMEAYNKWDTIINGILIVLIILTLIYKIIKKRRKQQAKMAGNEGNSTFN
jgi:hypothetical protein